jgi:hypothetical protein
LPPAFGTDKRRGAAAARQLKRSFMVVTGPEGSIRDLHRQEAQPNADRPMTHAVIAGQKKPVAPVAAAKKQRNAYGREIFSLRDNTGRE